MNVCTNTSNRLCGLDVVTTICLSFEVRGLPGGHLRSCITRNPVRRCNEAFASCPENASYVKNNRQATSTTSTSASVLSALRSLMYRRTKPKDLFCCCKANRCWSWSCVSLTARCNDAHADAAAAIDGCWCTRSRTIRSQGISKADAQGS
jgi:hypothetical protein